MHHFSKRATPITAEEATEVLRLGWDDYRGLVRAGRLAASVRGHGGPGEGGPGEGGLGEGGLGERGGHHSFWDLLGCDLWLRLRLRGLSDPLARTLAEELGRLLALAEEGGGGGPLDLHPLASRARGHHDALLGATIGALRRTHDLLGEGGPPRPRGLHLVATARRPGDPRGPRVLEMGLRRPGLAARRGPWPRAAEGAPEGGPFRPRAPA